MLDLWAPMGCPKPLKEYVFAPPRKWRFDFCWLEQKVAVEIEGGLWVRGRHSRGAGMIKDMEKYNTATKMGWRVFRFATDQYQSGYAAVFMKDVLNVRIP